MIKQESILLAKLEREEEIITNRIKMDSKKDKQHLEKYEMTEKELKILQEKKNAIF